MEAERVEDLEHATPGPQRSALEVTRDLVRTVGYEVMPFKSTERAVTTHVPTSVPLTVTTTEAKGIEVTLDLAERLRGHGYDVAPHLAARLVHDQDELAEIVARLRTAGIDRAFVIGGDAAEPAGKYPGALELLRDLETGHHLDDIGIGGYPEGHGTIPGHLVEQALADKQEHATHLVSQICFSATTTATWAESLVESGITLPLHIGMPGPVNRQKLVRISAGLGLGQSARFLNKQQGLWRFLLPGGYNPTRLVRALGRALASHDTRAVGLHIFTFNELEGTEKWRRRTRQQLDLD